MRGVLSQLQQLADELQTSDRTLRRAVSEGLIRAERPSPRKVDLPLRERRYLRSVWPLLAQLREVLRTEPKVSLAVLFGSHARGDASRQSDVDLMMAFRSEVDTRELASRLSGRLQREVQVVTLDDVKKTPLLFREVLRDGRVLIDRDDLWPTLMKQSRNVDRAATRARRVTDERFLATFGGG